VVGPERWLWIAEQLLLAVGTGDNWIGHAVKHITRTDADQLQTETNGNPEPDVVFAGLEWMTEVATARSVAAPIARALEAESKRSGFDCSLSVPIAAELDCLRGAGP